MTTSNDRYIGGTTGRKTSERCPAEAKAGDTVLIMGARDPNLPALSRAVFAALG
jgi:hypothetical protein